MVVLRVRLRPLLPSGSAKQVAEFIFCLLQTGELYWWKLSAGTIDIENEHGHRGAERFGLAPAAAFGRTLQRLGDASRVIECEYPRLEIKCVAGLGDVL